MSVEARPAKILVVDDTKFMRLKIRTILVAAGYEVIEADNGRQAVEQYRREQPDAVLMDITMPEMDGIEALGHSASTTPRPGWRW